jgi:hypothetical protein
MNVRLQTRCFASPPFDGFAFFDNDLIYYFDKLFLSRKISKDDRPVAPERKKIRQE